MSMFGINAEGPAKQAEESSNSNEDIRISIIGVGGAGCNTINRITREGIKSASTTAINTDQLHLKNIQAGQRVLIGSNVTKGLGAGGFPEVAQKCAEISKDKLREVIGENELVFLCAGMGGGTGTGASPIVAEVAKEQGAIVVGVVTFPFALERARLQKARWGLEQLSKHADTTVVIDNNRLVTYVPNLPINDAFALADNITARAVKGIADTIMFPSLMNIDYADVKSIMQSGGISMISLGEGKGNEKVESVVKSTLEHPLLDVSYEGAKGALIHIGGGESLSLGDSINVGEKITEAFDKDADIIMGARLSPSLTDEIHVTAVITGVQSPDILGNPEQEKDAEAEAEKDKGMLELEQMI